MSTARHAARPVDAHVARHAVVPERRMTPAGIRSRRRRYAAVRAVRRSVAVLGAVLVLGLGAGRSFAYFTAHGGSGSAAGATGALTGVVVQAANASVASTLLPGGTADLVVTVYNPNSVAVTVTSVAQNGALTVSGGTGCTSANAGVSVTTTTGLSQPAAAGVTTTFHLASAAAMATTSASGCQGAVFQVPVTVTVTR